MGKRDYVFPTYYGTKLVELKKMKYLNEILIEWNDSDIEDNGIIKSSDVNNRLNYQLIFELDKPDNIHIFGYSWPLFQKYKNKVYINGEHIELDYDGCTNYEYPKGKNYVYIEDWEKIDTIDDMCNTSTQLISIKFPESIFRIGSSAFLGCTKLTNIKIPNSVIAIDDYTFSNCHNLNSISIGNSTELIGEGAFLNCSSLTSVIIPNSVTQIEESAFRKCINLTSIIIPNSVISCGKCSFAECTNLASVTLSNKITSIKGATFRNSGLINIIIPNLTRTIEDYAFYNCKKLESITIPNSVKRIKMSAFEECKNLKTVYVNNINKFNSIKFENEYSNPTYYGAKLVELKK